MASPAEKLEDPPPPSAKTQWRARLSAWWHGTEPGAVAEGGEGEADPEDSPEAPDGRDAPVPRRTPEQLRLVQRIWGAGFTGPGGADQIHDLAQPLDLGEGTRLLLFGAGLGAPARILAEDSGVEVEAWDPDPAIAGGGEARTYSPDALKGGGANCDVLWSQDSFFTVSDKSALFDVLAARLSESGEILFTDYVVAEGAADAPAIQAWLEAEPGPRYPVTLADHLSALEARGFSPRSSEDIAEPHRLLILRGLESFMESLRQDPLERALLAELPGELELWSRRVRAIESGALEVCRVHAGR